METPFAAYRGDDDFVSGDKRSADARRNGPEQDRGRRTHDDLTGVGGMNQGRYPTLGLFEHLAGGDGEGVARSELHIALNEVVVQSIQNGLQDLRTTPVVEKYEGPGERGEPIPDEVHVQGLGSPAHRALHDGSGISFRYGPG